MEKPNKGSKFLGERDKRYEAHFEALEQFLTERNERYEARFLANEQMAAAASVALKERSDALEKATTLVAGQLERRLDIMNEFRGALTDQTATFVPRGEHVLLNATREAALDLRLASMKEALMATTSALESTMNAGFDYRDRALTAALTSAKDAVTKAEAASEKRLDSVNEFRQTLADQTASFIPRLEVEQRFQAMDKNIDMFSKQQISNMGRASGLTAGWGFLLGGIGAVGAIVGIISVITRH